MLQFRYESLLRSKMVSAQWNCRGYGPVYFPSAVFRADRFPAPSGENGREGVLPLRTSTESGEVATWDLECLAQENPTAEFRGRVVSEVGTDRFTMDPSTLSM